MEPFFVDAAKTLGTDMEIFHNPPSLIAIDLELFRMRKERMHRPEGEFALASVAVSSRQAFVIRTVEELSRFLLFLPTGTRVIFHNAKFDLFHLGRFVPAFLERVLRGEIEIEDTYLLASNLLSGKLREFSLQALSAEILKMSLDKRVRDTFQASLFGVTPEMVEYAAKDAIATFLLFERLMGMARRTGARLEAYRADLRAIRAFLQFRGFFFDRERWRKVFEETGREYRQISMELGFPVGSPQQTLEELRRRGIMVDSTRADVLEGVLRRADPEQAEFLRKVMRARDLHKRVTAYGLSFLDYVEPDGRIYSNYNIYGTETGRVTSQDPNLQQIPREREYRSCFIAPPGHVLIIADYSAQEPRVAAQLSGDERLIEIFQSGEDVYLRIAEVIFGDRPSGKEDPRRGLAKAIFLGTLYGMGPGRLSEAAGISMEEARRHLDAFFREFSGVARWVRQQEARVGSFVESVLGRRFYLDLSDPKASRNARNMPVQGSSADMSKLAIGEIVDRLDLSRAAPVAFVHDEIIVEAEEGYASEAFRVVVESMEEAHRAIAPDVPPAVDAKIARSWGEK